MPLATATMLKKLVNMKIDHFPIGATRGLKTTAMANGHGIQMHNWWGPEMRGDREVVGPGWFGSGEAYSDRLDFWYPTVRFRQNDATITPVRERELGDWKKLTLEEKKLLYRYSFCNTLAEFEAPNTYWKLEWAIVFAYTAVVFLYMAFLDKYFYTYRDPTYDNEYKEAMAERMVVTDKGRFLGPARYYDYENNRWKD